MENKYKMLREATQHLLEVQVRPSTEYVEEWERAVSEARAALRATK